MQQSVQTLVFPGGATYEGQVILTLGGLVVPHGYGTMRNLTGDIHTGNYYEGLRHGQGQSYSQTTQRYYNGAYVNGREEGFCTIACPSLNGGGTRQYVGSRSGGVRHGQGQLVEMMASGQTTVFEGVWYNDQLSGQGKFTFSQPGGGTHVYEGNFVGGRLEGWGTYMNTTAFNMRYNAFFQAGNVIQWG
jgi:hypothetical protein